MISKKMMRKNHSHQKIPIIDFHFLLHTDFLRQHSHCLELPVSVSLTAGAPAANGLLFGGRSNPDIVAVDLDRALRHAGSVSGKNRPYLGTLTGGLDKADGIFADNTRYDMPWRGQWHLEGEPDKRDMTTDYYRDGEHQAPSGSAPAGVGRRVQGAQHRRVRIGR